MTKPRTSIPGTVTMANGERRHAWANTYADLVNGGLLPVRIEFEVDANAASGHGRRYRKASPKQTETFEPDRPTEKRCGTCKLTISPTCACFPLPSNPVDDDAVQR
jgi:hypothetical protein